MTKNSSLMILYIMIVFGFVTMVHGQLVDNGDGTITDTAKDIMWTKNAMLSGSTILTYTEAVSWVNSLDYAGYTDWRLPMGTDPQDDPNRTTPDGQYYYNCSTSEFGNLFYNVLGGDAGLPIDQTFNDNPPYDIRPNTDPDLDHFENILGATPNACIFWTNIHEDASNTWTFNFDNGSYRAVLSSSGSTYRLRAWAVRDVSGQSGSNETPTSFAVLDGYDGAIPLAWGAPTDMTGFIGYDVHRYTMQGAYTELASQIQNHYFRDETAVNGTGYLYSVSAWYSSGESDMVATIQGTPEEGGFTLRSGPAYTAPTLDGHIGSAEWDPAGTIDITYPGVSDAVTLYAMNNEQYVYLAMDDPGDNALDDYDGIGIIFDEDLDRKWPATNNGQEGIIQIYWESGSVESRFSAFYGTWPDGVNGSAWSTPSGITHQMSTASGHVQLETRLDLDTSPFNGSGGDVLGAFFYSMDASTGFHGAWPQETANHLTSMTSGNAWAHGPFSFGDVRLNTYTDIGDPEKRLPTVFALSQNYPNPFNPETTIRFALPESSEMKLSVYNVLGKEIEVIVQGYYNAGYHTVKWDGSDQPNGIYLYLMKAEGYSETRKLILQK